MAAVKRIFQYMTGSNYTNINEKANNDSIKSPHPSLKKLETAYKQLSKLLNDIKGKTVY